MRLLDGMPWTHSSATNVAETWRAHGHVPPEAEALATEREARLDGALRAMLKIQEEKPKASVTKLDERRKLK